MNMTSKTLLALLLVAVLLPASGALAKKGQGSPQGRSGPPAGSPGDGPPYGPPSFDGPKGQDATPPYGPPSYAGPKNTVPGQRAMPPGQQKKHNKKKHGPPDHAPAWGYRSHQNQ